jgi:CRP-like cAMP-binding protein
VLNPLIQKLERFVPLSEADKLALTNATANTKTVNAHIDLIREGDRPSAVRVIMEGFAYRYKLLPNGGRQIVAYIVPGDICNAHVFILKRMDHAIATLSPCKIAELSGRDVLRITSEHPTITQALWWSTLVDEAVSREWITNIGRRSATVRIAHLLCEIYVRLSTVGLVENGKFELPITQIELADTVSITNIHANRVLNTLRRLNLIAMRGKYVKIIDLDALKVMADFSAHYLHLNGLLFTE